MAHSETAPLWSKDLAVKGLFQLLSGGIQELSAAAPAPPLGPGPSAVLLLQDLGTGAQGWCLSWAGPPAQQQIPELNQTTFIRQ